MPPRREGSARTIMPRPEDISPQAKARAGRTPTRLTPVLVRGHNVTIEPHHRDYVREKLGMKLGKFATAVERIFVRFDDVNGPKGGADHVCRIQASVSGMGVVVVEVVDVDPITAFDLAEARMMHAIEHRLGRIREPRVPAQRTARQRARARLPRGLDQRAAKTRSPGR